MLVETLLGDCERKNFIWNCNEAFIIRCYAIKFSRILKSPIAVLVSITLSHLSLKQQCLVMVLEQPHMSNNVCLLILSVSMIRDPSDVKFYLELL